MFDAKTPGLIVESAIQALSNLLRDTDLPDGAQSVLVDTLAGIAMSMGCVVPIISYLSRIPDSPKADTGRELVMYLLNHGSAREEYWANLPAISIPAVEEQPIVGKGGKAVASAKKVPSPEEEAKLKDVVAEIKGQPDPNRGPTCKFFTVRYHLLCYRATVVLIQHPL